MNVSGASASVLARQAMRELDRRTIAGGTPSLELMERAGAAIAAFVADPSACGVDPGRRRLLVIAGSGNNGGDGFVVARLLAADGWSVTVALAGGEPKAGSDPAGNLAKWRRLGGQVVDRRELLQLLEGQASGFDLTLDSIFGTGLDRAVHGGDAELIHSLNKCGMPVIAVDIPSGLCSDTGRALGVAVRARATLTIGAAKPGLFLADGPDYCGRTRVADIGLLPPGPSEACGIVLDDRTLRASWPRLHPLAHKGSRGHVLIVAGSRGKTGAAVLAARGALRAGAGLVTVACVPAVQSAVAAALPEAMTRAVAETEAGEIDPSAAAALAETAGGMDAIVVGPGMGTGAGPDAAVRALLAVPVPIVLDADALNVIAGWDEERRSALFEDRVAAGAPAPLLTPHPGEMSRLAKLVTRDVQLQRKDVAVNLAKRLASVVILKGAATIVTDGLRVAWNLSGNPGMAAGGMGDVLSGICGAISARRADSAPDVADQPQQEMIDVFERACIAVHVHGCAGDRLAERAASGFLAGEVADAVPAELARLVPR